jgi:2-oxoglutarate dehydrogenase E1 component
MGAWTFVVPGIERALDFIGAENKRVRYTGRAASAATATGLMTKHQRELKAFLEDALGEK